ncbi:vitronectin [Python bivittatus]|uniref:Vitronectin n=1 Tax=Python bivittatus TaxID=176946 RepID=A0A9F5J2N4_PYTBI|nr:vitronectin [Python bivittatus]
MRLLRLALLLGCLCGSFAAEESCEGRCDKGFDSEKKCQCDDLCIYYQSCCSDYASTCKSKVTRGDVFVQPEDDYLDYYDLASSNGSVPTSPTPESTVYIISEDEQTWTEGGEAWSEAPTEGPTWGQAEPLPPTLPSGGQEEGAGVAASGGEGDGEPGPLARGRGRSIGHAEPPTPSRLPSLLQGNLYWRFDDGVLEDGFPRNISDGFQGIPDDLDAALALPAENYFASEHVYFFKGACRRRVEGAASREDCEQTSPSLVFGHYTVLQRDSWEEFFRLLFQGPQPGEVSGPHSIRRNWRGLPGQLDAPHPARLHLGQSPSRTLARQKASRRHRKKYHHRGRWGRWKPQIWESLGGGSSDSSDQDWLLGSSPCQPFQSAYFFVDDHYYRFNLRTQRVDWVYPRYPRPIAKYWLGCSSEDLA